MDRNKKEERVEALKKLRRITEKEWVGGVCGGIAYWLGYPVWIVRLIAFLLLFAYGTGVVAYVLLWIFVPEWEELPEDYNERTGG